MNQGWLVKFRKEDGGQPPSGALGWIPPHDGERGRLKDAGAT